MCCDPQPHDIRSLWKTVKNSVLWNSEWNRRWEPFGGRRFVCASTSKTEEKKSLATTRC